KKELAEVLLRFGMDPIASKFRKSDFFEVIDSKKTNIKAFLLNQKYVAGIGNIYADEILFDSRVRPSRNINSLSKLEKERIYLTIKKILKKAIVMRGTTFSNYVDGKGDKGNFTKLLKVYQREDEPCFKCKKKIKKIRIAGRGTHYCSNCQR
ncbi:MAG: DNA-formamidopyrimidine glycosylase, partial [Parcubacteria group bacterium]|nr:DNA-formamidopyrimidine glycosylase [Parcubacteria group bacterium]